MLQSTSDSLSMKLSAYFETHAYYFYHFDVPHQHSLHLNKYLHTRPIPRLEISKIYFVIPARSRRSRFLCKLVKRWMAGRLEHVFVDLDYYNRVPRAKTFIHIQL